MIYYFAYGSNMDEAQMKERCPGARLASVGVLTDFALDFTIFSPKRACGCADVVPRRRSETYGLIYEISPGDLERLDGFENVPEAYVRRLREVSDVSGDAVDAFVYEVARKKAFIRPSEEYLGLILKAAERHGFPESYLRLIRKVPIMVK